MSYVQEIFGSNVKKYRENLNYTLESLSELIGISYQSLSKIESGMGFVTAKTLESLCSALKVRPDELFKLENLPKNISNSTNYIILINEVIKNLTLDNQKKVYKLISLFLS